MNLGGEGDIKALTPHPEALSPGLSLGAPCCFRARLGLTALLCNFSVFHSYQDSACPCYKFFLQITVEHTDTFLDMSNSVSSAGPKAHTGVLQTSRALAGGREHPHSSGGRGGWWQDTATGPGQRGLWRAANQFGQRKNPRLRLLTGLSGDQTAVRRKTRVSQTSLSVWTASPEPSVPSLSGFPAVCWSGRRLCKGWGTQRVTELEGVPVARTADHTAVGHHGLLHSRGMELGLPAPPPAQLLAP